MTLESAKGIFNVVLKVAKGLTVLFGLTAIAQIFLLLVNKGLTTESILGIALCTAVLLATSYLIFHEPMENSFAGSISWWILQVILLLILVCANSYFQDLTEETRMSYGHFPYMEQHEIEKANTPELLAHIVNFISMAVFAPKAMFLTLFTPIFVLSYLIQGIRTAIEDLLYQN
ncbi:hypothetical protein [Risungbinella massiliensis]|uniref:hypothetical protein n=1 Tax=Risungbinella massiliensis TaxID=1329796 RepID=UPI0005CC4184|nr:hypothetical protein [Risungbinella massiliensis]